mmetsp:Transcript_26769/g.22930  ORF Transcript_26769/g.22930 Transcript_26769/m.22930 type:complete len:91 (+) Transcript_26769:60-332(+)
MKELLPIAHSNGLTVQDVTDTIFEEWGHMSTFDKEKYSPTYTPSNSVIPPPTSPKKRKITESITTERPFVIVISDTEEDVRKKEDEKQEN